jgi:acetyl-CoA acetyltransferase
MRDVAIVAFAQSRFVAQAFNRDEVEFVREVVRAALGQVGLDRQEVGFFCSGSCDYVQGVPFSFVAAVDALGAWPPLAESHLEMDGAWALYEAYVRLQHGDIDSALIYCYGKPSLGHMGDVFSQQLDPYTMAPLWSDQDALAGLQAQQLLAAGKITPQKLAEISARSLSDAADNPYAHAGRKVRAEALLDAPLYRDPLRQSDVGTQSDGAACVILATRERAEQLAKQRGLRPAYVRGLDHRVDSMQLGLRDLTVCESAKRAAQGAKVLEGSIDVAELHARYAHEEVILREALGLPADTLVNPSGGCFGANAPMVSGLVRIGEVANRIMRGAAQRGVAHAASGPCLQQNLVCVLEGR